MPPPGRGKRKESWTGKGMPGREIAYSSPALAWDAVTALANHLVYSSGLGVSEKKIQGRMTWASAVEQERHGFAS